MRVFLAGATGATGKQLVPLLVDAGHEVSGVTRNESKRAAIETMGATAIVIDALDADQVGGTVAQAEPDVIIHELTAIGSFDIRNFDRSFARTNRLRTIGTD
jgi:nucleoside-diphosphate-sugar epimerase